MTSQRKSPAEAAAGLKLPPDVSFHRDPLPDGIAYVFRHAELGELGRLRVTGTASGETCVVTDIAGDEREAMFAQRRAILEPLSHQIVTALESIRGPSSTPPPPLAAKHSLPGGTIPVEEVRCDRCGAWVALLVFAEGATDHGRFEDVARQMYPHYAVTTVPTYIIGPEQGSTPANFRAAILKVWPQREPITTLTPDQFRSRITRLLTGHCR
ncbi:hypothetical protein RHOFW510R12_02500 [Rhodanobacter sp. FW510-R12]|uniref:Uncharacterized protein n=1 Tax=Rhodanobacter denitrificans TaxID=666685 RepID=M4NFZ8_9GAMM|nr:MULTISPECIES: hypothetical protein [Rhodanobacter]AGG88987.1 hypothetical protein R2APBS1_1863 [Rhodanobacter denitrificans]AGG89186.1 hypothetical protein R2APBS1_2064 [Rhodanobacter denitrificans]AGG89229.1 hypothetical protein R2APBS1_2108 [Rhodanobacter denitrificans]EIL98659.1 hypothetical protein UU5_03402 [Rhodanobacter sp. 115]KZC17117.1 hypothetical protein RHOFW104R8_12645 [Rhodanobacter sp. FW104-R8]